MKQILQTFKSGNLTLAEVPPPALLPAGVCVRTAASLISAGTEKMLIELAQKSLLGKAQARPDLVRQVLAKAQKEGWKNTFQNVISKMERPLPLGYSATGIVETSGSEVPHLKTGDRVAIAGAGYANHAEINYVPKNLVALMPEEVTYEEAAYTTVASIALQGVRLAKPELGEIVAVNGLGLIGLIAIQLLKANGCQVIGLDLTASKVALGRRLGMDEGIVLQDSDPLQMIDRFTKGRGVDQTLIAAATKSNQPMELAGEITRRKGCVVVVGAVGLHIPRTLYYKKELAVKISMSYGPGRYDASYEEGGIDYPYDYVRWTEQRNMEAVLELMAQKRLDVRTLTTHHFPFEKTLDAYEMIQQNKVPYIGIILDYDLEKSHQSILHLKPTLAHQSQAGMGVGFVGAGNYATLHLIPHLKKQTQVHLEGLISATGINAQQKADKFGFAYCSTDFQVLLEDTATDVVFIATRHSTHAAFATRALQAGKHVFVEKPMVVSEAQLEILTNAYQTANHQKPTGLMVGLNRRFAPMVVQLQKTLEEAVPRQMIYRVNSGPIPTTSWLHEPAEGGGMLIGEMCHFVDLMQFVAQSPPTSVYAHALSLQNHTIANQDNLSLTISYENGSVGTLCYNTIGDKAASKERLEVYSHNTVAILDDFRALEITQKGRRRQEKSANQNKGQENQIQKTMLAFSQEGRAPIPFEELVADMQVIFAARQSLASGQAVSLDRPIV